jgi:hypothetical protein
MSASSRCDARNTPGLPRDAAARDLRPGNQLARDSHECRPPGRAPRARPPAHRQPARRRPGGNDPTVRMASPRSANRTRRAGSHLHDRKWEPFVLVRALERATGIEPPQPVWKATARHQLGPLPATTLSQPVSDATGTSPVTARSCLMTFHEERPNQHPAADPGRCRPRAALRGRGNPIHYSPWTSGTS